MQLGIKDAARLLEVPDKTVYRWIEEGRLPAYRVNDEYRFNRAELLEWAAAQKLKVSPHIYREVDPDLPVFADALAAGGVHGPIRAGNKAQALEAAVSLLSLPPGVDRGSILGMMLAREAHARTAIGGGIAVPHARNPVVLDTDKPLVAAVYLDPPVDFQAEDKKPVHALFAIISTTIRGHLHLLSRLAYMLHDAGFLAAVETKGPLLELARKLEDGLKP